MATITEYEDRGDPAWSYQAILSVVNLNQFFNNINVSNFNISILSYQ